MGFSERTNAIIEPKLSLQWFVNMQDLSKPALENVLNGNIKFHPDKFKNTYRHWMENIKDWCISRQLWWGHRIPAYYFGTHSVNVNRFTRSGSHGSHFFLCEPVHGFRFRFDSRLSCFPLYRLLDFEIHVGTRKNLHKFDRGNYIFTSLC